MHATPSTLHSVSSTSVPHAQLCGTSKGSWATVLRTFTAAISHCVTHADFNHLQHIPRPGESHTVAHVDNRCGPTHTSAQHSTAQHSTAQHSTAQHSTAHTKRLPHSMHHQPSCATCLARQHPAAPLAGGCGTCSDHHDVMPYCAKHTLIAPVDGFNRLQLQTYTC
jgi:hypothetical protein